MFEICAVLSGFAEIQSMICWIQSMFDEIQCAIPSNADEATPIQDNTAWDQNAPGPILFAIRAIQDAKNQIQWAITPKLSPIE